MEEDNFNPFAVYEAFEKYHSFFSIRKLLKEKEDKWLESKELIMEEDPSIYPLSERCLTIANNDGEYMIDNRIFRVEQDGLVYEITDGNFEILEKIRNNQYDLNSKSSKDCRYQPFSGYGE